MKSQGERLDWTDPEDANQDDGEPEADAGEAARIQKTLDANNGSLEKTWRALGLPSRFALMRRLKKHKLVVRKKAE